MKIAAVVQARMGSQRLPGKVLMPLAGKPVLDHVLERLEHAERPAEVIVATSTEAEDDAVAAHCEELGVACHRGPAEDVVARLLEAAELHGLDAIARVNGDSPLLDQRLVDRGIALFEDGDAELVTNVDPRTFPAGQSVEVVASAPLARSHAKMSPEEREHVTQYFYANPGTASIRNFALDPPVRDIRFTVDTSADAERIERVIEGLPEPRWRASLAEILALSSELGLREPGGEVDR